MRELNFSSEQEAIQHLSDMTGKKVIIAAYDGQQTLFQDFKLDVTYQIVTEESARAGDYAETGFEHKDMEFDSLYEMIDYMLKEGAAEPSSSQFHEGVWYSTVDPIHDRAFFERGEEKTLSFHPKGESPEEGKIIFDSIKAGKNLAPDPDEEE